jgi:hypothetical protein
MRGAEREENMELFNLFFQLVLPAFIIVIFTTALIDVYVVMPILCNVIETKNREEL